jgi:DNA-binding MarR family transcriptional regulator
MDVKSDKQRDSLLDDLVGHQLRCIQLELKKYFYEEFKGHNLTSIQIAVLLRLQEVEHISQGDLGSDISVDPTILIRPLKDLEKVGFITRMRNPNDLRVQTIQLTGKGKQKANKVKTLILNADKRLTSNLSSKERATLLEVLHKIRSK